MSDYWKDIFGGEATASQIVKAAQHGGQTVQAWLREAYEAMAAASPDDRQELDYDDLAEQVENEARAAASAAAIMGSAGGRSTSAAKTTASRENGKRGGRPLKAK